MWKTKLLRCATATAASLSESSCVAVADDLLPAREVFLKPSSSPFRMPSILFHHDTNNMPAYAEMVPKELLGRALPTYKIASPSCDYYALRIPLLKAGFRRVPESPFPFPSNIIWGKSAPTAQTSPRWSQFALENNFQKFNHFPKSHQHLGCKRGMAMSLRKLSADLTDTFVPQTLFYPEEKSLIEQTLRDAPNGKRFIWKPARGSCGRGIMMCRGGAQYENSWRRVMSEIDRHASNPDVHEVIRNLSQAYVLQAYVEDPLLIDGRKIDLRLYVAVTSFDPLIAYVHTGGLVRFAAEAYDGGATGDDRHFGHLTNYSLGRKLERSLNDEQESAEAVARLNLDLKWPLTQFQSRLDSEYGPTHPTLSFNMLMAKANRVITNTLLSAKTSISAATRNSANHGAYVEIFGFDVMFDAAGNAWLVEVNTLPSLESSSTMDYHVKSRVVTDVLNMAQLQLFDRPASAFEALGLVAPETVATPLSTVVQSPRDLARLSDAEQLVDLEGRLMDEDRYRGGFQRIFPAPSHLLGSDRIPPPFSLDASLGSILTKLDGAAAGILASS